MVSEMCIASTEADEKLAHELYRQLNANPRRASASRPASETPMPLETSQPQNSKAILPPTPLSMASATVGSHQGISDAESSPLSSPPASPLQSSLGNAGPVMVTDSASNRRKLPDEKPVSSYRRPRRAYPIISLSVLLNSDDIAASPRLAGKPRGLTNITTSDADARSIPPPGSELQQKVNESKQKGELPWVCDSSVIRFVDGKWMAPQMCASCQALSTKETTKRPCCDRKLPCSTCVAANSECRRGSFMTLIVAPSKRSKLAGPLPSQNTATAAALDGFILAIHVSQNADSTWSLSPLHQPRGQGIKKRKAGELPLTPQRLRNRLRLESSSSYRNPAPALEAFGEHIHHENDVDLSPDTDLLAPPLRGKKRKVDDADFSPNPRPTNPTITEGHGLKSAKAEPARHKSTGNRKGGYVKYHQSAQGDKKAPYGEPPVWADKRSSLCETLPYYRAYMSGAHMNSGVVHAFMCDKEVGPRDKFEEEIIITSVGGGRKLDEESGQMIRETDQDKSAFAMGFQRAKRDSVSVAMIAGQGNRICPSKLPHYYNVLDWFHVTDVWCEKSAGLKCWMVRLEKIRLNTKSWWAAVDSPPLDPERDIHAVKTRQLHCNLCNRASKEIYNKGWACLETSCRAFFDFNKDIDDAALDYNEMFLKERTAFAGRPLEPLAPPLITDEDVVRLGRFGVESMFKNGIVCPVCKGCSRRIEWRRWTCETPGCTFTHSVRQKTVDLHYAISEGHGFDKEFYNASFGIRLGQKIMGMYDVNEYIIPGQQAGEVVGVIRHFRANGIINIQPGGPNELFRQMQEGDFNLKRNPVRQKGTTSEVLTSHWAANWGAPYKFGVSVLSKGFDEAPPAIIKALKRLTWAGEQTVTENLEPFHPFNELLSLGYFEDSYIGYHDDGEKELGPTVATLSLGGQAIMKIRPKAKSGLGPNSKNAKGTKADVLRVVLRHGDLIVMHGPGIQKLYEHAIVPQGKLRFALTCRYIRPELMANDEERRQAIIKGKLPKGHEEHTYDGDVNSTLTEIGENSKMVSDAQNSMNEIAARAIAGQLDLPTLHRCHEFFSQLITTMAMPERDSRRLALKDRVEGPVDE